MKVSPYAIVIAIIISSFFLIPNKNDSERKLNEENPAEAYDALSFLSAMNSFPNADIPADGYAKAWQQHQRMASASGIEGIRNAWASYGPNNIAGRTISIAVDPVDTNIVWVGAASGGLWKSITGGIGVSAWQYIETGFPVLGVGAIAINPANTQEMYIGTGEVYAYGTSTNGLNDRTQRGCAGIGILKSTDGGNTWSQSLDWTFQDNRGVWDIVFNPFNLNIVFAATTEGVYKTTDGGSSWNLSLDKKMVMDLVIDATDTNIVFAGVGNEDSADKGIYRTKDNGNTWTLLSNGLPAYTEDGRITLADDASDHNVLMALIGNRYSTVGIYRTADGGDSWTFKTSYEIVAWQGWYAKGLLIKANDNSRVLAGGVDIFKSNNSGSNFSDIAFNLNAFHSDVHGIISNPKDPNKIYIITDGGLFRSDDFGNSSYACNDGLVTSQHYIGAVSASNPDLFISGLQDNYTDKHDGSVYWTSVLGGDGTYTAINPVNDAIEFGASQYLNIAKTNDYWNFSTYGVYYSPSDPNGGNPAAFLAPFILAPSNPDVMYAGSSTLLRSDAAGQPYTWNAVQPDPLDNGNPVLSIACSVINPDTVYFATTPTDLFPMHVYRSFDAGVTKTDITSILPNRYPRRITVNPKNASEVYVVFSGFNGAPGGHIFKSDDAGTSWNDISDSLPDLPFHCLTIDPDYPQNLYAGCDFTVYGSINGGISWFTYGDGLPTAVMIFDLVVSPFDKSIYAFTYGHGAYKNALLNPVSAINDVKENATVSIFPNPASDKVTINLTRYTQNVMLQLYSATGALVKEVRMDATQQLNFSVTSLRPGSYLISLRGNGLNYSDKIAVLR